MSVRMQRFAAPWSGLTRAVTLVVIAVGVIVVGAALSEAEKISPQDGGIRAAMVAAAMIVPVILLITVVFAPLGYTVDQTGIMINRMGPKVCVLDSEIAEIRRIGRRDLGLAIRVWGSGGFFGFFGRFWSRGLGHYRMYATNGRELVCIRQVDGSRIVLSPHPADVFVEAVETARDRLGGHGG